MESKLLLVHALSPLHAGTGQGVDVIDLPIAREKATQIPFLPGSSIKGVFRDACDEKDMRTRVFGPDTSNAELHAGAVTFTDARLLLLPIRSMRGVFAWVTSPLLLRRLIRDAQGISLPVAIPTLGDDTCLVSAETTRLALMVDKNPKVILEDLALAFTASSEVSAWAAALGKMLFADDIQSQKDLAERICVVSDDVLSFLLETATEITARIQLDDDKKTVKRGMLWYEEALPAETVLVSMVVAAPVKATPSDVFATVQKLSSKTLQFGGKSTVGRGLCKATLFG